MNELGRLDPRLFGPSQPLFLPVFAPLPFTRLASKLGSSMRLSASDRPNDAAENPPTRGGREELREEVRECLRKCLDKKADPGEEDLTSLYAAEGLARLGDSEGRAILQKLRSHERWTVAISALHSLKRIDDPSYPSALDEFLGRVDWKNPENTPPSWFHIEELEKLGGEAVRFAFEGILKCDDSMVPQAAEALGRMGDVRAVPALKKLLNRRIPLTPSYGYMDPSEKPLSFRISAATALAQLGDATGQPVLLRYSRFKTPYFAVKAVRGLAFLKDPQARSLLEGFLDYSDIFIVEKAVKALGEMGDPAAYPALERLLRRREGMTLEIVRSLIRLGHPGGRSTLEKLLKRQSLHLRIGAIHEIGVLKDPAYRTVLEGFLGYKSSMFVNAAVQALGNLGDRAARPALEKILENEAFRRVRADSGRREEVVVNAIQALGKGRCFFFACFFFFH